MVNHAIMKLNTQKQRQLEIARIAQDDEIDRAASTGIMYKINKANGETYADYTGWLAAFEKISIILAEKNKKFHISTTIYRDSVSIDDLNNAMKAAERQFNSKYDVVYDVDPKNPRLYYYTSDYKRFNLEVSDNILLVRKSITDWVDVSKDYLISKAYGNNNDAELLNAFQLWLDATFALACLYNVHFKKPYFRRNIESIYIEGDKALKDNLKNLRLVIQYETLNTNVDLLLDISEVHFQAKNLYEGWLSGLIQRGAGQIKYKGRMYLPLFGPKGGMHILVKGIKKYVNGNKTKDKNLYKGKRV